MTSTDDLRKDEILDEMERTKWKRVGKTLLKDWRLYALLVPLLIFIFMFKYLPIRGVLQAFKTNSGINSATDVLQDDWYGMFYFKSLFNDSTFWTAFRNTFVNSMYGLVFGFPIPILLALLFSEIKCDWYRSILQVFSYLPKFLSTVVTTSIIILWTRDTAGSQGLLTVLFKSLGWVGGDNPAIWYDYRYFRPIYQISGVWEGAGYGSIVYFAAVLAISPTNYEAAKIDGASKLQQIRYVTLPSMAPTLTIMLIMRIGQILSIGYEKVLLLTRTTKVWYETGDVISTYVTRQLGVDGGDANYPLGTAADLFNALIAMLLVLGANAISRRVSDTALF